MSIKDMKPFKDAEEQFSKRPKSTTRVNVIITMIAQSSSGETIYAGGQLHYYHENPPRFSSNEIYLRTNPPYYPDGNDATQDVFKASQRVSLSIIGGDDPEVVIAFPNKTIKFEVKQLDNIFLTNSSDPRPISPTSSPTTSSPTTPSAVMIEKPHIGIDHGLSAIQLARRTIYIISFKDVTSFTPPG
ncbi:MAG TPA: hypothetical protein VFS21_31050 [Roseiflexaceae bacterium]|nr:hypothetical protein [Roseiflexaceae bacterium]